MECVQIVSMTATGKKLKRFGVDEGIVLLSNLHTGGSKAC